MNLPHWYLERRFWWDAVDEVYRDPVTLLAYPESEAVLDWEEQEPVGCWRTDPSHTSPKPLTHTSRPPQPPS